MSGRARAPGRPLEPSQDDVAGHGAADPAASVPRPVDGGRLFGGRLGPREERSAGPMILTLRTPDGFAVSFGLPALELMHRSARAVSAGIEASSVIIN